MADKPQWHIAVKNSLTSKTKWYYVVLYDFDNIQLTESDMRWINDLMDSREQSYILRKTMHGYHLIGLTPINALKWGATIYDLQFQFPTYHDSQAIRIDPKEIGEFIILQESLSYPFSLNLYQCIKFGKYGFLCKNNDQVDNPLADKELAPVLLYYTTNKKNVKNKEVIKTNG